jgi:DNA polymerase III alpha subunit (gram-positive type)
MKLVFDVEANGLYFDANVIHCICAEDIETGEVYEFRPDQVKEAISFLEKAEVLIGHNIINFDLPLIRKLHVFNWNGEIIDTLVWSRILFPERPSHSIESWAEEFGKKKVENEEWDVFTEHMLHRCTEDVSIQHKLYDRLLKEVSGD